MRIPNLFHFVSTISRVCDTVAQTKQSPDRNRFFRYSVFSVIYSLLAGASAVGAVFLFTLMEGVVLSVLFGLLGAALILGSLVFLLYSLVYMVSQFRINRKAMSWIALIVFLAVVAGIVVATLFILGIF